MWPSHTAACSSFLQTLTPASLQLGHSRIHNLDGHIMTPFLVLCLEHCAESALTNGLLVLQFLDGHHRGWGTCEPKRGASFTSWPWPQVLTVPLQPPTLAVTPCDLAGVVKSAASPMGPTLSWPWHRSKDCYPSESEWHPVSRAPLTITCQKTSGWKV